MATSKGIIEVDIASASRFYEKNQRKLSSKDDIAVGSFTLVPPPLAATISQTGFPHSMSFDSLPRVEAAHPFSPVKLQKMGFSDNDINDGMKLRRNIPSISTLETHPNLNYCIIILT